MGNRKQPFGYEMRMGRICVKTEEADLVRKIFQEYLEGVSYRQLTNVLNGLAVPYNEPGQPWNKNMVARILQDERYLGTDSIPRIIEPDCFQAAQDGRPRTGGSGEDAKQLRLLRGMAFCAGCGSKLEKERGVHWNCLKCGTLPIKMGDRQLLERVQSLLAPLTRTPEQIRIMPSSIGEHRDLEIHLEEAVLRSGQEEARAKEIALALAAAQLEEVGPERYESLRIRRLLAGWEEDRITMEQVRQITEKVFLGNGTVSLKLKNGQIVERGVRHDRNSA